MLDHRAESEVAVRLLEGMQADEVWLFGSRARGDAEAGSELDLLLVDRGGGGDRADDHGLIGVDAAGVKSVVFQAYEEFKTGDFRRWCCGVGGGSDRWMHDVRRRGRRCGAEFRTGRGGTWTLGLAG